MSAQATPAVRWPVGIIVLCVATVAMLWMALTFEIHRWQQAAITQAGRDATNLAMAFRENVKRTVSTIDQLMLTIIAENEASGDTYHIPAWLKDSPVLSGISLQVAMIGPDGMMT